MLIFVFFLVVKEKIRKIYKINFLEVLIKRIVYNFIFCCCIWFFLGLYYIFYKVDLKGFNCCYFIEDGRKENLF